MNEEQQKTYLSWLNHAHALESEIIKTLESQLNDFSDDPAAHEAIQAHLDTTRHQADTVQSIIERLGGKVSSVETGMGQIMGQMKGILMDSKLDKKVLDLVANYAIENLEIATYRTLIAAAKQLGDVDSEPEFENILADEQAMAKFISDNLENTVSMTLAKL